MSRSGYIDDSDDPLAHGRWRQAVKRALHGKRGQAFLHELLQALDEMEDRRLYPGSFATAEGEFCTLGVLGTRRGTKMDDLDDDGDCDTARVGERFGIAPAMAAEIMYMNDEYAVDEWKWVDVVICGPMPEYRLISTGRAEVLQRAYERHERQVRMHNDNHPCERWQRMRAWVVKNLKQELDAGTYTGRKSVQV
jgi:hypothetical protein